MVNQGRANRHPRWQLIWKLCTISLYLYILSIAFVNRGTEGDIRTLRNDRARQCRANQTIRDEPFVHGMLRERKGGKKEKKKPEN